MQVIESFIDTADAGTIVALGGSQNIGDGEFQSFVSEVVHDFISAELGDFLDGAAERKDAEHALAVNALSSQIKKLKQKVPGGLSSWRQKPNEAPVALEYKKSTCYRHLKELEDQMLEISQFDESRQQWLSKMLFRKYGDRGLVEEDIDSEKRREAEHCIWTGLMKALPLLRTNGRLDNHRRVVRQVLLTVIGAELPSHLRSFVAREMSLGVKALREYSDVLDDLSGGNRLSWFTTHGAERSTGRWGKTPQHDLDAASQWWVATSVQSANKKDLVRNPADRTETHLLCYNYEGKREKHLNFAAAMQRQQLVDWASAASSELATAHSGDLAVVSLCSSTPPFFLYIQIDEERLFSAAELGGDVVAFKTQFGGLVAEDDVWIVGLLVIEDSQEGPRSQRRRHLSRSRVRACAPAKLTRRVIRGGTHAVPPRESQTTPVPLKRELAEQLYNDVVSCRRDEWKFSLFCQLPWRKFSANDIDFFNTSEEKLEQALELDSTHADAWFALGWLNFTAVYSLAFDNTMLDEGQEPNLWNERMSTAMQALENAERYGAAGFWSGAVDYMRGVLLNHTGDRALAIRLLVRSASKWSRNWAAHAALAKIFKKEGDVEQELEHSEAMQLYSIGMSLKHNLVRETHFDPNAQPTEIAAEAGGRGAGVELLYDCSDVVVKSLEGCSMDEVIRRVVEQILFERDDELKKQPKRARTSRPRRSSTTIDYEPTFDEVVKYLEQRHVGFSIDRLRDAFERALSLGIIVHYEDQFYAPESKPPARELPHAASAWKLPRGLPGELDALCAKFWMSISVFLACESYFIRKGKRQTCLCQYHLRWDLMMEAIIKFERKQRAGNTRNDSPDDDDEDESDNTSSRLPPNPSAIRHALLCAKADDGSHRAECVKGSCAKCGSHGKFGSVFGASLATTTPTSAQADADLNEEDETIEESMSDEDDSEQTARQSSSALARDKGGATQALVNGAKKDAPSSSAAVHSAPVLITYDQWKKRVYVTRDGRTLYKHDFVRVEVPLSEYWSDVYK